MMNPESLEANIMRARLWMAEFATHRINELRATRTVHHVKHPNGHHVEMVELSRWDWELDEMLKFYAMFLEKDDDV